MPTGRSPHFSIGQNESCEEILILAGGVPGRLVPRAKSNNWTGLFIALGQEMREFPPRLRWRDSVVRYFGVDPLIGSRGREMRWVRRERPVKVLYVSRGSARFLRSAVLNSAVSMRKGLFQRCSERYTTD
jgi:hypothetical protein